MNDHEQEGWALYAAEQERHAETARRLEEAERQIDDHYDAARDRLRERDEAIERLRLMTREVASAKALADRWQGVLAEVLADSPSSIITDRSVSTLDGCLRELRRALDVATGADVDA